MDNSLTRPALYAKNHHAANAARRAALHRLRIRSGHCDWNVGRANLSLRFGGGLIRSGCVERHCRHRAWPRLQPARLPWDVAVTGGHAQRTLYRTCLANSSRSPAAGTLWASRLGGECSPSIVQGGQDAEDSGYPNQYRLRVSSPIKGQQHHDLSSRGDLPGKARRHLAPVFPVVCQCQTTQDKHGQVTGH